jgi:hypothetical protein
LDNFCGFACFVGFGTGHFLHVRRVHPPPVGFGHRRSLDSGHSRPKSHQLAAEKKNMKPITLVGILLVVLGVLALAYQGLNYNRQETVMNVGPMHVTTETHERIPLPPILGGLALAGGVVLLVFGAKQKA